MKSKPYHDKDLLAKKYIDEDLSPREISEEWGCSHNTIYRWLDKHSIREQSNEKTIGEEILRELYVNRDLSTREVAEELGCSSPVVLKWLDKYNIERTFKITGQPRLETNPGNGYEIIRTWDIDEREQIPVHRLAAVAWFGFEPVKEGKHVHHKSGVPWDNREENFEMVTPSEHIHEHKIWEARMG